MEEKSLSEKYFTDRRSIRRFSNRPVSDELLGSILEKAFHAPNTGNMQLYSVVSTRESEKKSVLAALNFNQPAATGCDVMLTVCADFRRFSNWCRVYDAEARYDNLFSFLTAMTDAVILSQQICTVAEMVEGLGTCYLGSVTYNIKEISELLELPEQVVPVCCLAIGYKEGEGVEERRLPTEAVWHKESYKDFDDNGIRKYYDEKEHIPANRNFIEENGKQTLAQVFTDLRYPPKMFAELSEKMEAFLREKKFLES